ncbi:MAG: hypothetical protein M1831_003238 [Alyxoria varia]|nr:MAG: hypothetical protein M1831_003238 [Alyxoria varia]
MQWSFCPANFRSKSVKEIEPSCILPILRKQEIRTGGSAETFEIEIHDAYHDFRDHPDPELPRESSPRTNTFALKIYHPLLRNEIQFRKEIEAFTAFRHQPMSNQCQSSMIKFHAAFEQAGTYNVILELADGGTLEDMFGEEPPRHSPDIKDLWFRLVDLLKSLRMIQSVKEFSGNSGQATTLKGLHQDVKPDNILLVRRGYGPRYNSFFRLADLGLCHFRKVEDNRSDVSMRDAQGTRVYGAPETYRSDVFAMELYREIKSNVDVWSFGCVLSEACVWLVDGPKGLERYRNDRRREAESLSPNFAAIEAFHDGGYNGTGVPKVLKCVQEVHAHLEARIMREDVATLHVLNLIRRHMVDPRVSRPEVGFCLDEWEKAKRLIQRGKQSNGQSVQSNEGNPSSIDTSSTNQRQSPYAAPPPQANEVPGRFPEDSMNTTLVPTQILSAPSAWPMSEAKIWKMAKDKRKSQPLSAAPCRELKKRDHYFLVDDSISMRAHWVEVVEVVSVLTEILLSQGADDKIDVAFTGSEDRERYSKSLSLARFVERHVPEQHPISAPAQTNPADEMSNILDKYGEKLSSKNSWSKAKSWVTREPGRKALSLYVLTDGAYQQHSNLAEPIRRIIHKLETECKGERYVGIQFIRFGNDQAGKKKLRDLDRGHGLPRDIVDTTKANGDTWKMLLGAINDTYDFAEEDEDEDDLSRPQIGSLYEADGGNSASRQSSRYQTNRQTFSGRPSNSSR